MKRRSTVEVAELYKAFLTIIAQETAYWDELVTWQEIAPRYKLSDLPPSEAYVLRGACHYLKVAMSQGIRIPLEVFLELTISKAYRIWKLWKLAPKTQLHPSEWLGRSAQEIEQLIREARDGVDAIDTRIEHIRTRATKQIQALLKKKEGFSE